MVVFDKPVRTAPPDIAADVAGGRYRAWGNVAAGLKSHEAERKGYWASKIGQLRLLMEQGHSLSSALSTVHDLLPDQTISAIRGAESTGTLPDVLIDEAKRISRSVHSSRSSGISAGSLIVMTMAICSIMSVMVLFLMYNIVPKFKEIFIGFGVELPAPTILLIHLSDWLVSYWYLFVLPGLGVVFFGFLWVYSSSSQRFRRGYHRFMQHWPRYWLPGLLRQLSLSAANRPTAELRVGFCHDGSAAGAGRS